MGVRFFESPFHATEPKEVADALVVRTRLCALIRDAIEERGWTQQVAADALDVTQPKVSMVVNGKVDRISAESLIGMLLRLDYRVTAEQEERGGLTISISKGGSPAIV